MLKIYIFVFCIFTFVNAIWYDCTTNATVYLEPGEIAFFQTPNYPVLIYYQLFYKGNLRFIINDTEIVNNENYFVVHLYQYDKSHYPKPEIGFSVVNSTSYFIQSLDVEDYFCSVQGYIFVDNSESTCPMESLSKNNPYLFEDETQIIHIQSGFFDNSGSYIRLQPCQWRFAAPLGYGFKVVFTMLNLKSELFVTNSTDIIVNHGSIRMNFPYYNNDKYLQIDLSKSGQTNFTTLEFQAYITVVKNNFDKINGSCATPIADTGQIWSNRDEYQNNFQCTFELVIKPNTEVVIDPEIADLEYNVDFITYYTNENDITTLKYGSSEDRFVMGAYENGSEKHVYFEFEGDGSVISSGFTIKFYENVCQCVQSIDLCRGNFNIMGNPEYDYVCANLKCRMIIEPCRNDLYLLSVSLLQFDINDIFKITSNDEIIFSFQVFFLKDNTEAQGATLFLNPLNKNILEIHTSSILLSTLRDVGLFSKRYKAPTKKQQFKFSLGDPTFLILVSPGKLMTFEISVDSFESLQNAVWNIYAISECKDKFYNNASYTIPIINDDCYTFPKFAPCKIKRASFAIFNNDSEDPPCLYAITPPGRTKNGCVFDKNNVHYPESSKSVYIGALATNDGTCVITIVNPSHYISHVFTTSFTKNVQIFIGIEKKEVIFEFNSKTAKAWKDVYLFSNVYTVIIPKNASFFMALEPIPATFYLNGGRYLDIKIDSFVLPYKSIIDTRFSDVICLYYVLDEFHYSYFIGNDPVMFTIIYRNVFIKIDETEEPFQSNLGDSFIFKNQTISIIFNCIDSDFHIISADTIVYIQNLNETALLGF